MNNNYIQYEEDILFRIYTYTERYLRIIEVMGLYTYGVNTG